MKVLDLFAGLGGWSAAFRDRGHDVVTVDLDPRFGTTIVGDILTLRPEDLPWQPDVVLASPPCEAFSVMTIGRNWAPGKVPKTDKARVSIELVKATRRLIDELDPAYFVIENPRAMLRKLAPLADLERRTVTYCQYGEQYMKPTDLWGGFPPSLVLHRMCKPSADCHRAAPRGSSTGIQGNSALDGLSAEDREWLESLPPRKSKTFRGGFIEDMARFPSWSEARRTLTALRAKVPYDLSMAVCEAAELDMITGARPVPTMLWSAV